MVVFTFAASILGFGDLSSTHKTVYMLLRNRDIRSEVSGFICSAVMTSHTSAGPLTLYTSQCPNSMSVLSSIALRPLRLYQNYQILLIYRTYSSDGCLTLPGRTNTAHCCLRKNSYILGTRTSGIDPSTFLLSHFNLHTNTRAPQTSSTLSKSHMDTATDGQGKSVSCSPTTILAKDTNGNTAASHGNTPTNRVAAGCLDP